MPERLVQLRIQVRLSAVVQAHMPQGQAQSRPFVRQKSRLASAASAEPSLFSPFSQAGEVDGLQRLRSDLSSASNPQG